MSLHQKGSSKREDANQSGFRTLQEATREKAKTPPVPEPDPTKNPEAVEFGRLGGAKGGKARAKALTAARQDRGEDRKAQVVRSAVVAGGDAEESPCRSRLAEARIA